MKLYKEIRIDNINYDDDQFFFRSKIFNIYSKIVSDSTKIFYLNKN